MRLELFGECLVAVSSEGLLRETTRSCHSFPVELWAAEDFEHAVVVKV